MSRPAIGEIVHYVSYGTPGGEFTQKCRAAIVADLPDDEKAVERNLAALVVHNPSGVFFNSVPYADPSENKGGTWHWMHGRSDT